ncbi:MAG: 16S rRNA (adenine(1518)-N(6)/adenine(1519)-N(6))-dimethyltransferase RsmA [Candidatus Polarisedimenticolia bacterium]
MPDTPHRPRRRFGQNFLVNTGAIDTIVRIFRPRPDDLVLEIGPGRGALTRRLAGRVARLVAVEIDPELAAPLRTDLAREIASGALEILTADVLMLDLPATFHAMGAEPARRVRVIANLPYNIAAAVILRLLALPERVADLLLMVQREVAARILAPPGGKTYGALSVLCRTRARVESVLRLRPGSFRPVPKVDSEVLRFTPVEGALPAADAALLEEVLRAAFGQRRKTLLNNLARLSGLDAEGAGRLIRAAGLEPGMRAEQVPVAGFLALARARRTIIRP